MKTRISNLSHRAQQQLGWGKNDMYLLRYTARKLSPLAANDMLCRLENRLNEKHTNLTIPQEMWLKDISHDRLAAHHNTPWTNSTIITASLLLLGAIGLHLVILVILH